MVFMIKRQLMTSSKFMTRVLFTIRIKQLFMMRMLLMIRINQLLMTRMLLITTIKLVLQQQQPQPMIKQPTTRQPMTRLGIIIKDTTNQPMKTTIMHNTIKAMSIIVSLSNLSTQMISNSMTTLSSSSSHSRIRTIIQDSSMISSSMTRTTSMEAPTTQPRARMTTARAPTTQQCMQAMRLFRLQTKPN